MGNPDAMRCAWRRRVGPLLGLPGLLVLALVVLAVPCASLAGSDTDKQATMASKTYLDAHPDLKYRVEGFNALEEDRCNDAMEHFVRAASYGDKPAQAILAEMAWEGRCQPVDRSLAYAWADLAAERGYPAFLAQRERYWASLSEDDRARAIDVGRPLLEQYGDAVAKPRMARHLRLARRYMLSGRPRRDVTIVVPSPSGQQMVIRGHDFYANHLWEPKAYQEWVDETWNPPGQGTVDVGDVEQVKP